MMDRASPFSVRYTLSDRQTFTIPLSDRDLTVGSAETADVHVDSTTLSRLHTRITLRDGRVYLTDLNSRNGTFLNGKRLQPHVEYEWTPGDYLRLPDVNLELLKQQSAQKLTRNELKLTAAPALVRPGQIVRLTLTASGEGEQQVTLQAQPTAPGLAVDLNWQGGSVMPDTPLDIQARIRATQMSLWGGVKRVRFAAISQSNLLSTAEVTVRLRTRLETLALALFLLMGCGATTVAAAVVVPQVITAMNATPVTPTDTPTLTSTTTPTLTPTSTTTGTLTATSTPTLTPTFTLTPPVPPTICPRGSTLTHIIQPGQTLFSIGLLYNTNVAALALNNHISDPDKISAGQALFVRCGEYATFPVTVTTPAPVPTCEGFRPTSPLDGLACGLNTFYWDAAPGADHYVVNLYNESGAQVGSFQTTGSETSLTTEVNQQTAGAGFSFGWEVQALQNGQVICTTRRVTIPRAPCPTPVPPKPDLVVSSISQAGELSWSKECTVLSVPVTYVVANRGGQPSGTFATNLHYYRPGSNEPLSSQCEQFTGNSCPEAALNPGESVTFSDRANLFARGLAGGSVEVMAVADIASYGLACTDPSYCRVDESNEGNNASTRLSLPVPDCVRPADLAVEVTYVNVECSGDNQITITYAYDVMNNGPSDAPSIAVKEDLQITLIPLDGVGVPGNYPGEDRLIDLLAVGARRSFDGSLTVSSPTDGEGFGLAFDHLSTVTVSVESQVIPDNDTANNTDALTEKSPGGGSFFCDIQIESGG